MAGERQDEEGEVEVEVHPLSEQPTEYWKRWKHTANVMRLQVRQPATPPAEDKVSSAFIHK